MNELAVRKEELQKSIAAIVSAIKGLTIKDDADYAIAEEWRKRNRDTQDIVTKAFEPERVAKKAAYDAVLAEKKLFMKPLEETDEAIKQKQREYIAKLEELRREAERVRREAEEEKKRLEEQAKQLFGDDDILPIIEAPPVEAAPVIAPQMNTRKVWRARIADQNAFFAAVLRGQVPEGVVIINQAALDKMASVVKEEGPIGMGITVYCERVPVLSRVS